MRHAARLRLVINNSSSESDTPSSRALRSKSKCHLPGMALADGQLRTVDTGIPKIPATVAVPPKRLMIAETFAIADYTHRKWTRASSISARPDFRHGGNERNYKDLMPKYARLGPKIDRKKAADKLLKKQIGKRLSDVRLALEYRVRSEFADTLDLEKHSTYRNYERGTSFPPWSLVVELASYGASVEYIILGIGEPLQSPKRPPP